MSTLHLILLSSFGFYFITGLSFGYLASYLLLKTVAYLSPWLPVWLWFMDIGLYVHAIAIAATSAVGFIAVIANKNHAIKVCIYILLGLLLASIATTVHVVTSKASLSNAITTNIRHSMLESLNHYSTNMSDTQMWNEIQIEKNCCGIKDYRDWFASSFGNGTDVPDSCCLLITKDCGHNISHEVDPEDEIITEGCLPTILSSMCKDYHYYGSHVWLPTVVSQIILIAMLIIVRRKLEELEGRYFSSVVMVRNQLQYKFLDEEK